MEFKERNILTVSAHLHYILLFIVTTVSLKAPTIVNPEDRMAPRKKQGSPMNSISQVPPPEEWLPTNHGFAMIPPIHIPSHTRPPAATLSAPDKRSISTSSTATIPAPSERPANTSNGQDITQMPQATSARDKDQRKCNIAIHEQEMRKIQHFIKQRQNDFNNLQEESDRAKRDIDKAECDKRMMEQLLKVENELTQKEEECDILVTVVQTYEADYDRRKIPRPSLTSPLQGRNVPIRMNHNSSKTEILGDVPEIAKD
ncbi:MAG: hypothetical protein Q9163_004360 [Psora crenata]